MPSPASVYAFCDSTVGRVIVTTRGLRDGLPRRRSSAAATWRAEVGLGGLRRREVVLADEALLGALPR